MTKKFDISFGCLSESITHQLKIQGLKYKKGSTAKLDNTKEALCWMILNGIITESELDKVLKRFMKHIATNIASIESDHGEIK